MEQIVKFETESTHFLNEYFQKIKCNNILLITGKNSFEKSGAEDWIIPLIAGTKITRFCDFEENPKYEDLLKGVELFNSQSFDLLLAIGGGSVLDMAKLIRYYKDFNGIDFLNYKCKLKDRILLIAIPTTSGTGSEATHFAVLYKDKVKYSIADEKITPNIALINSSLTISASSYLTAVTGLDAFSQAIESYWSVNSTKLSRKFAKEAIELIWRNLSLAVKSDISAKSKLAKAAYYAGKAINISKTTAPHAISYPFTSYFNIPHGHAVALTIGSFFEYNFMVSEDDLNDPRGTVFVKNTITELLHIFSIDDVFYAKKYINQFISDLEINLYLKTNKIDIQKSCDLVLNNVNIERLSNNPRKVNKQFIKSLLLDIFK